VTAATLVVILNVGPAAIAWTIDRHDCCRRRPLHGI
jgi:hypothetical protein